jgi:hypothetical protein
VTPLSSSTSDLPKKIVSPERASVLPVVFDSDKYEAVSIQLETLRLSGVCTTDLIKSLLDTVHKLSEDVTILQKTMPNLNPRLINYMAKLVNIKENCPEESFYRQTRKSLTHLHRPHVGIQPGVMPSCSFWICAYCFSFERI